MKQFRTIIFAFALLLASYGIRAQGVVASAGNESRSLAGSYVYTVGEICGQQLMGDVYTLVEGVQSFYDVELLFIDGIPQRFFNATVAPNPAVDHLSVQVDGGQGVTTYRLIDMQGRTVRNGETEQTAWILGLATIPSGMYILMLTNGRQQTNQYRIIKKTSKQ